MVACQLDNLGDCFVRHLSDFDPAKLKCTRERYYWASGSSFSSVVNSIGYGPRDLGQGFEPQYD